MFFMFGRIKTTTNKFKITQYGRSKKPMNNLPSHISDFISVEFKQRNQKNSKYSLRAFARDLDISPTTLSHILKRKVGVSNELAQHLSEKINFILGEKDLFNALTKKDFSKNKEEREASEAQLFRYETRYNTLTAETFTLIKEWYHLAIMELTKTKGFMEDVDWIAEKLSITSEEASAALKRLINLGVLERVNGNLYPAEDYLIILSHAPSEAARHFQLTILQKLITALSEHPRSTRDISSTILRFKKEQIDEIKLDLKNFRRDLSLKIQAADDHDSVYCLTTALFQLDYPFTPS